MKRFIVFALALTLVFSLCSCGSISSDISSLQKEIAQLQQENKELKEQLSALQGTSGTINDNTLKGTENVSGQAKTVTLNTPFSVSEIMTITLHSSEWCDKILPSNTSGSYSYMDDNEGEKYFVIRGELKNLASETLDIQYASKAQMTINEKYKFPVTLELEENDGKSFYGNAKPLQTLNLIVYASVSDELYEACENIQITMDIVNDESKLGFFYDEKYPHDSFTISFDNKK